MSAGDLRHGQTRECALCHRVGYRAYVPRGDCGWACLNEQACRERQSQRQGSWSWREIAGVLAERMQHHAFCLDHRAIEAKPDCPFCRDRAAYERWVAKSGRRHHELPPATRTVSPFEVHTDRATARTRGAAS